MTQHLLFVDDEKPVLNAVRRVLHGCREEWKVDYVERAAAAWESLLATPYDAVVTDVRMPGMSGLELLERIQNTAQTRGIPVVVLTGVPDQGLKQQALDLGATDLLNKPVDRDQLISRLKNVLRMKSYVDGLREANTSLHREVEQQKVELVKARLSLVCRLGKVAEHRDEQTGNHVLRVGHYSWLIAAALGLDRATQDMLLLTAPLHDIGKIGIPDQILLKPGPLSPGEWAVMQTHCLIGHRIFREQWPLLGPMLQRYPGSLLSDAFEDPLLETAAAIALCHHEKWDGTGYPQQLTGKQIPLEARIVAVADVFDALMSSRPYKRPYSEEQALKIIATSAGAHFCPEIYAAFLTALPEIRNMRRELADGRDTSNKNEGEEP